MGNGNILGMKTVILPGVSIRNREWAEEIQDKLTANGLQTTVHEWEHWKTGEKEKFFAKEDIEAALGEIGGERVNIIAKSYGTYIAIEVLAKIKNQINKLILCGIPLGFLSENKLGDDKYKNLASFPADKIMCMQNEGDPVASYKQIKEFVGKINSEIKVVKKDREDHHYPYPEDFIGFLKS